MMIDLITITLCIRFSTDFIPITFKRKRKNIPYIRFLCRKIWDNQLHLRLSYVHRITISFSYTCPYSIQTTFMEKMK